MAKVLRGVEISPPILDGIASISVMRRVFHLSLPDTQELISQAEKALQQQRAA